MEIVDSLMVKIALIGLLGIGAQWIAWRTGRPAIALMLIVGIIAGPILGIIDPERDFGALQEPIIKLAVAVILFEGGLSLNFRELRQAGGAVTAMVFVAGPIAWVLGTAAAHYGAGLSWEISALLGGIMIVTGPTVIGPMLRTLRVPSRVRNILKWEGIVNDPIGALLAVGIYAYITYEGPDANIAVISMDVLAASFIAGLIGAGLGFALTWLFPRGKVPEYLKAPFLLVTVIFGFVIADLIKHETGLITVTVMGIVMANRQIYSSQALYRFKEDLAVLLISGVFIILSATLDWETVQQFRPQFVIFLILLLFVVRPISVLVALLFSSVPWRERLFIAWIAPRGIVAVAITGLFAIRLVDYGFPGAEALVPLSFAVVIATIFAHGFSASWVAERLGISEGKGEGILIAGANRWSISLGKMLKSLDIEVLVTDNSKFALRRARSEGLAVRHGDVLDEAHNDNIDMGEFQHLIAATDNDSQNQLITADLGPEMGYEQISRLANDGQSKSRVGHGRLLFESGTDFGTLLDRDLAGWRFSKTNITEKFTVEDYRKNLETDEEPLAVFKPDRRLLFFATDARPVIEDGDVVISYVAPDTPEERKADRAAKESEKNGES
ncbi:sodium:proton antiporter [Parasphingorhabdus flavimaris]|uniref:Sodium:proton antiporter n=1 Tax=Parasphingorhabdus flavimaris TaxID=266812 RepID=A0ABX2N5A0_9SPHN|nr:sodium:proton antiporter [Parasphingorhabdus flavimaris]NVD28891.1 sodium:proton antiporter [Parasphingorhabdus flavimaris]